MISKQLDLWPAEALALPWGGLAPRSLAQEVVTTRLLKHARGRTCGVDNSVVCCRSREAQRFGMDPAQLEMWVPHSFKEV